MPLNQREYSWEEEHVRDLFTDFADAIARNQGSYFLGTIVLTRGVDEIPEVSDGQQRLATTTILLAAIRDYLFLQRDMDRANQIEQDFLLTTDLDTTERVPRLRLNVDDNEFFKKFVLSKPGSRDRKIKPTKPSHERIKKAAEIGHSHIKDILGAHQKGARINRLLEWVKFVRRGAQVILLRVPDHLNSFIIFETLNDRGLKISQADLLKNHLFHYAGNRIQEAQQKWAQMTGVLESLGNEDVTVMYLHHVLITKFGPTKEREVFGRVRELVNSQNRSLEFLDEIAEGATDYSALFNSDHKKWNEYGSSTRKHIATINVDLRVEQIRPLMFAVSRHFSVKEAKLAFRSFVWWSVRFLIAGGRGGILDRNYAFRAQEIATGKIKTAKELTDVMAEIVPTDGLFEATFAEARVSHIYLARYYLRALELKRKGEPEPEWVPNEEQVINLEHILPENPGSSWKHVDPETASAFYKRLGNMVILQAKKNSIMGNSGFAEKKKVLQKSTFLLTSEVAKYTEWGPKEIETRQKELAKLSLATWPLKV